MNQIFCLYCGSCDVLLIDTYKRWWRCCVSCGTAVPQEKERYLLSFLPYSDLKKGSVSDPASMYDYMIEDIHIKWSEREGREYVQDYLNPAGVNVAKKNILDISGGNGYFIKQIKSLGATVTLTEFNRKVVEWARANHEFKVFEYDINRDELLARVKEQYDIVFARACIMFAENLDNFVREVNSVLKPGGIVMVNRSMIPTLGILLRTQLDEFSYLILRQVNTIIEEFANQGFELIHRKDEIDSTLYVYDHDLLAHWRLVYRWYERKNLPRLLEDRESILRARDRRFTTLTFRKSN